MKDYLFYNIPKDSVDFGQFRGHYNIYLLCRKGQVCFHQSNKKIEAKEWDFVVWPRSKKYSEDVDAEMLLVSDYFLDFYKPETAWDVPGRDTGQPTGAPPGQAGTVGRQTGAEEDPPGNPRGFPEVRRRYP